MSLIHANIFSIMLLSISGNRILMEISILSPVRFGPLKNQWCMRYESKNAQMKRFVSRSFKNVPLTVAIHHQQWMCYHLATRPGQATSNFLYNGDEIMSGKNQATMLVL